MHSKLTAYFLVTILVLMYLSTVYHKTRDELITDVMVSVLGATVGHLTSVFIDNYNQSMAF